MRLSPRVRISLRCPCCHCALQEAAGQLRCSNNGCAAEFPLLHDVPILLNSSFGFFDVQDNREKLERPSSLYARLRRWAQVLIPHITANVKARTNYLQIAELLAAEKPNPLVLVIGGGTMGIGIKVLTRDPRIELVETDVAVGPRAQLICDAHRLPFADGTFDGVVIQGVAEYLQEPSRCVDEIYRVLGSGGIVYSEAPFMQPVHGREHDFARFTHVGHRRLYRHFVEISSGVCSGPAAALACFIRYFLLSFVRTSTGRDAVKAATALSLFWLKYLDYFLIRTKGAIDAASATFFLGRKSQQILSDQELLLVYKGAVTADGIFSD